MDKAATGSGHQIQRKREIQSEDRVACYLIVHCMSKRKNIGNIIRSCSAFGVESVLVVGKKKDATFYGAKGTRSRVNIQYFASLESVRGFCTERGVRICGIEIMDQARAVHEHPWTGSTAFILGNEGTGLSKQDKAICDSFV